MPSTSAAKTKRGSRVVAARAGSAINKPKTTSDAMKRAVRKVRASAKAKAKAKAINLRIDDELRALIDKAAAVSGENRTDFMLRVARVEAENVLLDQVYFRLNDADWNALQETLDKPPKANAALKKLMQSTPAWERN